MTMGNGGFAYIAGLTPRELRKLGIVFSDEARARRFCDLVQEDMEVRIGEEVTRDATEDEIDLFDRCVTDEEMEQWLNRYCPGYRSVVENTEREIEEELIARHSRIPGAKFSFAAVPDTAPLGALGLKPEFSGRLLNAGIRTAGQIRQLRSVYDVTGLTPEERYDLMMLRGRI